MSNLHVDKIQLKWKKNGWIKVFCFIICTTVGNFATKIKLHVYT